MNITEKLLKVYRIIYQSSDIVKRQKVMKNLIFFFPAVLIGFLIMLGIQSLFPTPSPVKQEESVTGPVVIDTFSPKTPPSHSLTGKIDNIIGDVEWESRQATETAKIALTQDVHQGEKVKTATGSATIQFENIAKIIISPDTDLDIIQTLPNNLVFNQHQGLAEYNKLGDIPISVRIEHLLIDINSGDILVLHDKEKPIITLTVRDGAVTAAYNDLKLNSKVLNLKSGDRIIFHDDTRRVN
jgi:hypothetical protein